MSSMKTKRALVKMRSAYNSKVGRAVRDWTARGAVALSATATAFHAVKGDGYGAFTGIAVTGISLKYLSEKDHIRIISGVVSLSKGAQNVKNKISGTSNHDNTPTNEPS